MCVACVALLSDLFNGLFSLVMFIVINSLQILFYILSSLAGTLNRAFRK